jgi:L-ascorbate metabolism protein UlaG (beta-lactamase superfamily)
MSKVPSQTQIEALEIVNVLLVPVGGGNSLNAAQAAELVSMLEPNIVVPMHYQHSRPAAGAGWRRALS